MLKIHTRNFSSQPKAVSREAGEGKFQALVWFLIMVWVFLAGMEVLPKRYRVSQFEDAMVDAGERAGQRGANTARIKGGLLWEADQLDLPVTKDNLAVEVNANFVRISVDYTVPLRLPGYTYVWEVHHELRRKIFRF